MNQTAIFWPMLLQVALIYAVYVLMSYRRRAAIRAGSVRTSDFRENRNEPPESLFVRNNLVNQFELPVLFFVACLALYVTNGVNWLTVSLAWVFAISRCGHAAIHVTTNRIRHRRPLFIIGFLALFAMWFWFALHIAGLV
jgi:hypothetical protein